MWLVNRLFIWTTRLVFPRRTASSKILSRAYFAISIGSLVLYILLFGIGPLISYINYKFFGGEPIGISIPAGAFLALLITLLGLRVAPDLKKHLGLLFIRCLGISYEIPSRGAMFVLKHKSLFRILGPVCIVLAFPFFFIAHQRQVELNTLQEKSANLTQSLRRFVDRRPISARSRRLANVLIADYCSMVSYSVDLTAFGLNPCDKHLLENLADVFQLDFSCKTSRYDEAAEDFELKLENPRKNMADCRGDNTAEAYLHAWNGRILLALGQQGRVLANTVTAHNSFKRARNLLTPSTSGIENGIGSVFAHYAQNYQNINSTFTWRDIDDVPQMGGMDNQVPFVAVLNKSLKHLRLGRDLEKRFDPEFAEARYLNNISDLCYRILRLRNKPYVRRTTDSDPLAGIDAELHAKVSDLRSKDGALRWIHENRTELAKHLNGSDVLEVLVTIAQMGSLEIEILGDLEPVFDGLSPVASIQAAILMGFRNKDFFENPNYMGMCPVIKSPVYGEQYLKLLSSFLGLKADNIRKGCPGAYGSAG